MPRPRIRCAGSRRTTTPWWPRASRASRTSSPTGRCAGLVVLLGLLAYERVEAPLLRLRAAADRRGEARGDLDEQAHAVAARAGAEGVAAVVVQQRRAEHVDVRPRPLAGEALEEGSGRDRIAIGPPRRVAQV